MNKENIARYCALVAITGFVLLGVKYAAQYLTSATIDWNIAIGLAAIALPLLAQIIASLWRKQKENQLKIEQVQDALACIPTLQLDIGRLNQTNANIAVIEERLDALEQENRRQERLLARLDAVIETIIKQEQLAAKVDRLSEAIAALQVKTNGD